MTSEHLSNFFVREPFVAINLRLADGRHLAIQHPEFAWLTPGGAALWYMHPTGQLELIDPDFIVSIQTIHAADPTLFLR